MRKRYTHNFIISSLVSIIFSASLYAQSGPKVLVVDAHPDDETSFPVMLYKITHDLKGTVDLALLTDGQGGFNGSELGSVYYGYNLTDSKHWPFRITTHKKKRSNGSRKYYGYQAILFF